MRVAVTNLVVTMAGRGTRFRQAGYDIPKFAIEVHGRTLFAWALLSLSSWWSDTLARAVFIAHRDDDTAGFVATQCQLLGLGSHALIQLDHTTDGQATTAMAAEAAVDAEAPLLIYNIDTHVRPEALDAGHVRGDGWLPCFPGQGSAWSFARADADGRVDEVREKERISDDATVGLYWFRSFSLFRSLYQHAVRHGGGAQAGERYVAPLYRLLLDQGGEVYLDRLADDDVVPLGTPAEVEAFAAGPPPVWHRP